MPFSCKVEDCVKVNQRALPYTVVCHVLVSRTYEVALGFHADEKFCVSSTSTGISSTLPVAVEHPRADYGRSRYVKPAKRILVGHDGTKGNSSIPSLNLRNENTPSVWVLVEIGVEAFCTRQPSDL